MKKIIKLVIMVFMMSFAGSSLFAQNEITDTLAMQEIQKTEAVAPKAATQSTTVSVEDLANLLANTVGEKKQNILGDEPSVSVPFQQKGKFTGQHVCQRLELSILADKSETSKDMASKLFGGAFSGGSTSSDSGSDFLEKLSDKTAGLGFGANFGYSVVFVPGYKKEGSNELELNRFGFGYSVGLITQADHEQNSGVSWDFLGKVGVETGFNKAIGVGVDLLFGGGKTSQTVLDFSGVDEKDPEADDLEITSESLWCGKIGTQLWVRLNFLTKSIKNFDTAFFTRFVYSFRPYSDQDEMNRIEVYSEIPIFQREAWSVGLTLTYFF